MNILNKFVVVIIAIIILSSCASGPRITSIDDNEAFKYERQYLKEFEIIKQGLVDNSRVKWVQASNKKQPCKVYVGYQEGKDRTLESNYKYFWDGDCKNSYAYGVGREFERSREFNADAIVEYSGEEVMPKYYVQSSIFDGVTKEGDINNGYAVQTKIIEENFSFDINYQIGFFGSFESPVKLVTFSSPFNDSVGYTKIYPNFAYSLDDSTKNEFAKYKYTFLVHNNKRQKHGFGFETPKYGNSRGGEFINGNAIRIVNLPKSYFSHASSIFSSVKEAEQKAIYAQKRALAVKKRYTNRICKESVKVDFMDNDEYKKICRESEHYAELLKKYNKRLEQFNQAKTQKRAEIQQRQIINAQQQQAYAAQQQAKAAKEQAFAAQRSANAAQQSNNMQMWQNIMSNTLSPTNYSWSKQSSGNKLQYCYVVSGIEFCN